MKKVIDHLRRALLAGGESDLTDGQLLECFVSDRDEAAVTALVHRHAQMVWSVCRRVLHSHHDVEDAFQATFLVLVRKAASIRPREMLVNWLYGVARQTALKARATKVTRMAREKQVKEMPEQEVDTESRSEIENVLDQELSRLPDKYRVAIIMCYLEGKTHKEAARQLEIPEGTLTNRLVRARTMLAKRFARHNLAVAVGSFGAHLSHNTASALVPASAVISTIKAVTSVAAGKTVAAGLISARVAALTEGMVKSMFITELKTVLAIVFVAAVMSIGAVSLAQWALADSHQSREVDLAPASDVPPPQQKDVAKPADKGGKDDQPKEKGRVDPASAPLEARLVAKQATYNLDRGGKSPEEYAQMITAAAKAAEKGRGALVAAPQVDLILELHNTSDKEIMVIIGGDATGLSLNLNGPGALDILSKFLRTDDLRYGKRTAIAAGEKVEIPITKLSYGRSPRNQPYEWEGRFVYWTKPGDYTLTASYRTVVSPIPKGAEEQKNGLVEEDRAIGFGRVTVTSAPIKLKVVENVVREIDLNSVFAYRPGGEFPNGTTKITSAEELAKVIPNKEDQERIAKQFDFAKDELVFFHWVGLPGEYMSFRLEEDKKEPVVIFVKRNSRPPGPQQTIGHRHIQLYAVARAAKWRVAGKQP